MVNHAEGNESVSQSADAAELAWYFSHVDPAVADHVYDMLGTIRRACPVARSGEFGGYVLVTGYDEIREAGRRDDVFSAYVEGLGAAAVVAEMRDVAAPLFDSDNAAHHHWRRLLREFFTPDAAAGHRPYIQSLCRTLLREIVPRGEADLVAAYTRRVPPLVIGRVLGLAKADRALLAEHVDALDTAESADAAQSAGRAYADFLLRHVRMRQERPSDDLLSRIVNDRIAGQRTGDFELVKFAMMMVAAGHLTTADTCASAVAQLLLDPDIRQRVTSDPSLLRGFVDETIRHEPAVAATGRAVVSDYVLGGVPLTRGDRVLLTWGSANRDERHFPDGAQFRLDRGRDRTPHLGWGAGAHRCLGRHLARIEIRVMLEELLAAIPDFRLSPGTEIRRTYGVIRGVRALPVRWSAQ